MCRNLWSMCWAYIQMTSLRYGCGYVPSDFNLQARINRRRVVRFPMILHVVYFPYSRLLPGLREWASYQIRKIAGCASAGNAGNVFPRHRGLVTPTCITARARRMCRDGCRDRLLAVSFEVGGGENIPGACATGNFTYLVRGPCQDE